MTVKNDERKILVTFPDGINLGLTLSCGQCFRWSLLPDGSARGVVRGTELTAKDMGEGKVLFTGIGDNEMSDFFADYFDMGRDYTPLLEMMGNDPVLEKSVRKYGTVRILNQEPWETLVSFIFSSCNNIPRISGIVERLCAGFGEKAGGSFSFPSPEVIASLTEEDFAPLRAGYRVPFVLDAAKKVAYGETVLEDLKKAPLDEARAELMKILGVGKKVADCTLLFSLRHAEAFPVDRHIARFAENNYPEGLPGYMDDFRGIAQQYMFIAQREETR